MRAALAAFVLAGLATSAHGQADAEKAKELAAKNLCLSCHKVDAKLVGPAYKDVAAKYKDDPAALDKLVAKVVKGGKGVWGNVAMPAHKDVPESEIRTIVTWVLSLPPS